MSSKKELLIDRMEDQFIPLEKETGYCVLFKGKRVKMQSGKTIWTSPGAAKNAINHCIGGSWWYHRLMTHEEYQQARQELMDEGILEIKQMSYDK